jgi:hypothetical protein
MLSYLSQLDGDIKPCDISTAWDLEHNYFKFITAQSILQITSRCGHIE